MSLTLTLASGHSSSNVLTSGATALPGCEGETVSLSVASSMVSLATRAASKVVWMACLRPSGSTSEITTVLSVDMCPVLCADELVASREVARFRCRPQGRSIFRQNVGALPAPVGNSKDWHSSLVGPKGY